MLRDRCGALPARGSGSAVARQRRLCRDLGRPVRCINPDFERWDRHGESAHDRWVVFSEGRGVMTRERLGVTLFLIAAAGCFLLSIALWFTDHQDEGLFVGL
jgi:hypothetical protein